MGEVYLGFDRRLERRVAVKTIRPEQQLSAEAKARFLREARLLSRLGHPGICQVFDLVETPAADFLVLEYIEGKTLRQLAAGEDLPLERKLRLAVKIAEALAAAHQEQVVHRDLKPDNVMVTPAGGVKVLDFGVARSLSEPVGAVPGNRATPRSPGAAADTAEEELAPTWSFFIPELEATTRPAPGAADELTRFGFVVGTVWSMSPEQAAGQPVTTAGDLYSLGVLLQELLTGKPVYAGETLDAVWGQVRRAETVPFTGFDPEITALVSDLLNLDPRRRPTAEQAVERLLWILDKPQRLRRRRLRLALVSGGFAVLLVLLAVVTWLAVEAERARQEAEQRRRQAEEMIGFMVGDLRVKLEGVGRLDLLDEVGDRALAYFEAVPRERWSDEELAQRTRAILQIGEVQRAQGDLPKALTTFRGAGVLVDELARRAPAQGDIPDLRRQVHEWIAQVAYDQGRNGEALAEWRRTLDIVREQLQRQPESFDWKSALATAYHNIGTALEAEGDLDAALTSYRESLTLQGRLLAEKPDDPGLQAQRAATLAFVSNLLERNGDLAGSLAERRAHLALLERRAALQPDDSVAREELATARGFLASLVSVLGDLPEAEALYRQGLTTVADLSSHDPENSGLRRWLGAFHSNLGRVRAEQGELQDALSHLRDARVIFEDLVKQDGTNADWRLQLGAARSRTAAALVGIEPAAARQEALAALAILEPLAGAAPDESVRGQAAEAAVALGRAEDARGDRAAARAAYEKALTLLAPCRRPIRHWKQLAPWVKAQFGLGHRGEALPELRRLLATGYRGADVSSL